jgi:hypothetical protein
MSFVKPQTFFPRFFLAAALALASGGCASLKPAAPDIDPAALEQINRMRSAMERTGTYQMTFETLEDEALASGQLVQAGQTAVMKVARPDHLSLAVERDSAERWSAWIDGVTLTLVDESKGLYSRLHPPPPLDQSLDELGERYGLELPLIDVVSGLRRAGLLDRVQTGLHLGTETVAGAECHHLLFRQAEVDWQIWIETADPALPRKILITFKDEPGQPVYQTTIAEWNLAPNFRDSDWEPKLPKEAREVGIDELLGQEDAP